MKYTVTATVSGEHLGDALSGLHKFTPTVSVSSHAAANTGVTAPSKATAPITAKVKVKRHTRSKRDVRDGSLNAAAKALIESYGTPAFELKDLMARAKANGLTSPTVYRAIGIEMKAGRLAKIKPGLYQRKGAGFAQQFGFGS